MNRTQLLALVVLTIASALLLGGVDSFVFGLMDNAPMLALMLMAIDPDSLIGERLARFNISPAYLACGVAMLVNTATDGVAGLCDPNAAFFGVVVGCLVPIAFLPIIWKLRAHEGVTI